MNTPFRLTMRLLLTGSLAAALAACGSSGTTGETPNNPPGNETPVEQPPVEQPPVEQPPVEEPPVEQPPVDTGSDIKLTNLDGVPFNDRLVFNRIQNPTWDKKDGSGTVQLRMHDVAELQIKNTADTAVQLSGVNFSKPVWKLVDAPSFPVTIPANGTQTLKVRFVATGDAAHATDCRTGTDGKACFYEGTLTLNTTDPDEAQKPVQLAGFWQSQPESDFREPSLQEIVDLFGYKTQLVKPGQELNPDYKGTVTRVGDEILAPYWLVADPAKDVEVRQLAAFHGAPQNEHLEWFPKGSPSQLKRIIDHDPLDAQTLLPREYGFTGPAYEKFKPSVPFGLKVDYEWSDPALNVKEAQERPKFRNRCGGDGGHNVRVWPVKDREGQVVANTYLIAMDAFCINYDYNDNVYILSNVKPVPTN